MKWPRWSIARANSGDFLPAMCGGIFLFISLPGFVMLWLNADRGSAVIAWPLMVVFGAGIALGLGFILFGIRICSSPGSLTYRLMHGRLFSP